MEITGRCGTVGGPCGLQSEQGVSVFSIMQAHITVLCRRLGTTVDGVIDGGLVYDAVYGGNIICSGRTRSAQKSLASAGCPVVGVFQHIGAAPET